MVMAKIGRKVIFHGAFRTKTAAARAERSGEYIIGSRIKGRKRFLLLSRRDR